MAGLPFETWLTWTRAQRLAFIEAMTDSELRNLHMDADEYFCAAAGYAPEPTVGRRPIPISAKRALAERHGAKPDVYVKVACPCGAEGEVRWFAPKRRGRVGFIYFRGLHVDHIRPVSRGGTNDPDNLRLLCPRCNLSRGNRGVA